MVLAAAVVAAINISNIVLSNATFFSKPYVSLKSKTTLKNTQYTRKKPGGFGGNISDHFEQFTYKFSKLNNDISPTNASL